LARGLALLLLLSVSMTGCSIGGVLAALTPGGASVRSDIPYGTHPRQQLDVYLPAPADASGFLVVFFYGGSWNSGSRSLLAFVGEALASRGHVAVLPDYRLYPEVRYPDFLEDSAAATRWAIRQAEALGADPRRIVLAGHSAGAYNAAMLAFDDRWLKAEGVEPRDHVAGFAGLAGPYEFLPIINPEVQPVFHHPDVPPGTQPIEHVDATAPPTWLGVAPEDELVDPQRNSGQLAERLRAAGVPAEVVAYEGTSHITLVGMMSGPLRWWAPVLEDIDGFVRGLRSARPR
jgi:acetyl esterase/lipase